MRRAAAILGLLLLSACRNLAPPHVRPELPVTSSYPPEVAGDATAGTPATDIGWREFFVDERLEALIATALEQNREMAIAIAQIEQAGGFYRIQDADRLPTVVAGADASRSRIGGETIDRYSIGVAVPAFELDFRGRVRNLSEAARAEYLATVEGQRAFRLLLIREVALAYLFSLEAAERIELAEATVARREEGLEIARVRLEAGITSALEFRQAETLLTQAQSELAGLRLAKARNDHALAVLIGGAVLSPLPEPVPLAQQVSAQTIAAGLPSELLVARPDIMAAEERLRAARADIGAARAAFFPSIALTGNFGFASSELGDLLGSDGLTWGFGPSISLPIFNRGRLRGNLTVAEASEAIAIAGYERTIQIAFREVADALAGRRYLAEQVAAQERGTRAQREIAELARIRYREGVVRYLEVLDAERSLFAAEQALLQLRRAQAENLVTLYVALGGGSEPALVAAGAPESKAMPDAFLARIAQHCNQAFEGRIVANEPPSDDDPFAGKTLVMHVRECGENEIRIPFHVGDDHSRTWVLTRTASGLRLKHDHRHQDGTDDAVTMYGGDTATAGTEIRQEFPVDQHSIDLFRREGLTASLVNVWAMEIEPGRRFLYELARPGQGRLFQVEFDLTTPVPPPPAPWGHPEID